MKKKKIAKYIQEAETPIKPKVLYDKVTWGDMLTENEKTFLRNVLEDESHSKDEGLGIAIEAFALSHTATRENITLVEKFLDEDFHNGIFAGNCSESIMLRLLLESCKRLFITPQRDSIASRIR